VVATANKISKIMYTMIKHKKEYDENMLSESQQKYKDMRIKKLEKQLRILKDAV
jgi:hypothetical protein